jgi:hypothetical protein
MQKQANFRSKPCTRTASVQSAWKIYPNVRVNNGICSIYSFSCTVYHHNAVNGCSASHLVHFHFNSKRRSSNDDLVIIYGSGGKSQPL